MNDIHCLNSMELNNSSAIKVDWIRFLFKRGKLKNVRSDNSPYHGKRQ